MGAPFRGPQQLRCWGGFKPEGLGGVVTSTAPQSPPLPKTKPTPAYYPPAKPPRSSRSTRARAASAAPDSPQSPPCVQSASPARSPRQPQPQSADPPSPYSPQAATTDP